MKNIWLGGAVVLALLAGCGDQQAAAPAAAAPALVSAINPLVNVPSIAGKPADVVAQQLGETLGCETIKYGQKCTYRDKTEVVFIDGQADWITVHADLPFSADAMPLLGFKPARPSFDNENTMRWSGEQNTLLIQLEPGTSGRSEYAYVKVRTP